MARSRDISKVLSSNSTLATDAEVAASYQTKAAAGLTLLTPTSIANTSGTASIGANGTVSFTSASAISLNDVFSATYDNYRIIINSNNSTVSAQSNFLRMRVSGADNSSSNYRWSGLYIFDNSATPTVSGQASNGLGTSFYSGGSSSTAGFTPVTVLDLSNPFATKHTSYVSSDYSYDQFGTRGGVDTQGGVMSVTTSYTGFTIVSGSGTITGSISVYGYNK